MNTVKVGTALVLSAFSIHAETILSRIGWRGPEPIVVIAIGIIFFLIVVGFIGYHVYVSAQSQKAKQDYSEQQFNETATRIGLTKEELKLARRLADYEKVTEPQVVLQSVSMYEKCVDAEIARLRTLKLSNEEIANYNTLLSEIRKKTGFFRLPFEYPLSTSRNISTGQVGSIFGTDHRTPLIHKAYVSESNEFTFTLKFDVEEEDLLHVRAGDTVKFVFSRQADSVYGFTLRVAGYAGDGALVVEHTADMKRNQLRQFVRIEASLPLKIKLLKTVDPEKSEIKKGVVTQVKMSDISGGGISFLCEQSLRVGDIISVAFSLPAVNVTGVAGKILRISVQEGKTKSYFKHHVKFTTIEQRQRDAIVKYVFDKQRQLNQLR